MYIYINIIYINIIYINIIYINYPCLQVIPQLIARIDTPRPLVSRLIHQVLTDLGKFHPQALVYREVQVQQGFAVFVVWHWTLCLELWSILASVSEDT